MNERLKQHDAYISRSRDQQGILRMLGFRGRGPVCSATTSRPTHSYTHNSKRRQDGQQLEYINYYS